MNPMYIALGLFALTYILLLALPKYRCWVALASAVIFVVIGILPAGNVLGAIDFNVLMMIAGTMGLVSLFIESGMPALMADLLLDRTKNVRATIIALSLFAGIVSAFVDNVATVLMIAPVALSIAKKFDISPVPMIIAISVSSNLQGAATLVGDTTSILLGGYANMDFMDFFWFMGRPGMFWVVEIGAGLTVFVLLWLFRNDKQPTEAKEHTVVTDFLPSVLLGGTVLYVSGRTVKTQYISANEEGKHTGAIDCLFDQLLRQSGAAGFRYFDFGTSNLTTNDDLNEPLIFQKEGFGGRAVCYDSYEWKI